MASSPPPLPGNNSSHSDTENEDCDDDDDDDDGLYHVLQSMGYFHHYPHQQRPDASGGVAAGNLDTNTVRSNSTLPAAADKHQQDTSNALQILKGLASNSSISSAVRPKAVFKLCLMAAVGALLLATAYTSTRTSKHPSSSFFARDSSGTATAEDDEPVVLAKCSSSSSSGAEQDSQDQCWKPVQQPSPQEDEQMKMTLPPAAISTARLVIHGPFDKASAETLLHIAITHGMDVSMRRDRVSATDKKGGGAIMYTYVFTKRNDAAGWHPDNIDAESENNGHKSLVDRIYSSSGSIVRYAARLLLGREIE